MDGHSLFSYVILTTLDFKNRVAHLHRTDNDESDLFFDLIGCTINAQDIGALRDEILREGSPVPKGLKRLVSELDI